MRVNRKRANIEWDEGYDLSIGHAESLPMSRKQERKLAKREKKKPVFGFSRELK